LICRLTAQGVTLVDIAHTLGLGERTMYRWIYFSRRGERDPVYARLVDGLQAAECERQAHIRELLAAARGGHDPFAS
jgi:hypothetical protein